MIFRLRYVLCAIIMMAALPAQANEEAASYNCNLTPESCVSVSYELVVEDINKVQESIDKQFAAMESIAAETKAGKIVLQSQNYNISRDRQNNVWRISGFMYYALRDKASVDAFTLGVQARGYGLGDQREEICSH